MATFFRTLVIVVGLLIVFSSTDYLRREKQETGEYYALVLFSIVGQCVMVTANELIMIFIGLEISSIASYILAGYLRDDCAQQRIRPEVFPAGIVRDGIPAVWRGLDLRRDRLHQPDRDPQGADLGCRAAGSADRRGGRADLRRPGVQDFRCALSGLGSRRLSGRACSGLGIPYCGTQGRRLRGPDARIPGQPGDGSRRTGCRPIWVCALATMVVGNFAAIMQSNIKRLLAYSSIAHAGYVLVAVAANSGTGSAAVMFYLAAYAFTNIGAFAVVTYFAPQRRKDTSPSTILPGSPSASRPWPRCSRSFLLSLIGVPLTGGFFGKFYIFKAALDANLVWLTVLGLLNSAVAAYYYLRILVVMYMREPGESVEKPAACWCAAADRGLRFGRGNGAAGNLPLAGPGFRESRSPAITGRLRPAMPQVLPRLYPHTSRHRPGRECPAWIRPAAIARRLRLRSHLPWARRESPSLRNAR